MGSGFRYIRKKFRQSDIDAFGQFVDVQNSTSSNVAYRQDGRVTWEWRDWKQFISGNFKAIRKYSKYRHLRLNKALVPLR